MRRTATVLGILLAVVLIALVSLPFLIDANTFRPKLESELTGALGREVKVGDLKLAIFSGAVAADDLSIADDPAFSPTPFIRAKSLKVGVELSPLIFSRKINVTGITIDQPEVTLLQSASGEWNFATLGSKSPAPPPASPPSGTKSTASGESKGLDLSVRLVKITDGRFSMGKTLRLENVDAELRDFSASSVMPFSLSAKVAGQGEIKIEGKVGPIATDVVMTPAEVSLHVAHLDLAASGIVDRSLGITGLASIDGTAASNGKSLDIAGHVKGEQLKLVKGGSPAKRPVELDFALAHDLQTRAGSLKRGEIHIGSAKASLTGTYRPKGEATLLDANLSGPNMPVSELEAMLPALNITLPSGSSLQGGSASVKLALEGPTTQLVANGTLSVNKTRLTGFSLGTKMKVIQSLAGIQGLPDTDIETFSTNVRASQTGGAALEDIKLVVPAVGELSGAGTVSPANALDFKMSAMVHASGVMAVVSHTAIPLMVQGTASDPVFKADVKGLAKQELNQVKGDAVKTGVGLLENLLNKKTK